MSARPKIEGEQVNSFEAIIEALRVNPALLREALRLDPDIVRRALDHPFYAPLKKQVVESLAEPRAHGRPRRDPLIVEAVQRLFHHMVDEEGKSPTEAYDVVSTMLSSLLPLSPDAVRDIVNPYERKKKKSRR